MPKDIQSAFTTESSNAAAVTTLAGKLAEVDPKAIVFFASHHHDGAAISAGLRSRFPGAEVIGCTTAGEFAGSHGGTDGVTALALGSGKIRRCAAALAPFGGKVESGIQEALGKISRSLEVELRDLDPRRYVGLMLVEGLRMKEEAANEALGNAAPLLQFVGGSAGDNLEFKQTRVFHNGAASDDGCALLLLESKVPFTVAKTCSFQSTGKKFRVTRADVPNRVIHELDGKPVLDVYANAVGLPKEKLSSCFMKSPLGLLIDGAPWIRSPQRVLDDGGLKFYCQVLEGMEVHVMQATPLVEDMRACLTKAQATLGAPISGGLAFNCILRRLELDADKLHKPFLESFEGMTVAGFHTYGESYLGHINQTFTSLLFG